VQKTSGFSKNGASTRTRKKGVEPGGYFWKKKGVIFRDFLQTSFKDVSLRQGLVTFAQQTGPAIKKLWAFSIGKLLYTQVE